MPHAAPTAPFEQPFAYDIYKQKYAHPGEEWPDTARRVATHVLAALYHAPNRGPDFVSVIEDATTRVERLIAERRFMPGGRYLYATAARSTRPRTASCSAPRTRARAGPTSSRRRRWR